MSLRAKLEDQLKDFTVRTMERSGVWCQNHIDRMVSTYDYIQIGAKVRVPKEGMLVMEKVVDVEVMPPQYGVDSIHVILDSGSRFNYYELLPN